MFLLLLMMMNANTKLILCAWLYQVLVFDSLVFHVNKQTPFLFLTLTYQKSRKHHRSNKMKVEIFCCPLLLFLFCLEIDSPFLFVGLDSSEFLFREIDQIRISVVGINKACYSGCENDPVSWKTITSKRLVTKLFRNGTVVPYFCKQRYGRSVVRVTSKRRLFLVQLRKTTLSFSHICWLRWLVWRRKSYTRLTSFTCYSQHQRSSKWVFKGWLSRVSIDIVHSDMIDSQFESLEFFFELSDREGIDGDIEIRVIMVEIDRLEG